MRHLISSIGICCLIISCQQPSTPSVQKYPDLLRENFKGEPLRVERLNFIVDSSGSLIPDSLHYEIGEWKDGYLSLYTEIDSGKINKNVSAYSYYPSGLLKSIDSKLNGKQNFRLEAAIDAKGHNVTGKIFDSAGKLSYFDKDLKQNETGQVISGTAFDGDSSFLYYYSSTYKGRQFLRNVIRDSTGKIKKITGVKLQADNEVIADSVIRFGKDSTTTIVRQYQYSDYDSLKNWLQRTELNAAGTPIKIINRKITYVAKNE
ncbi:MAG: hypothetical protein EOO04_22675 [Chitinophagaceae bacterium]|nr:MAG: hypothetical protein EOO04_22675 [Chitinophagaceae bacterium]